MNTQQFAQEICKRIQQLFNIGSQIKIEQTKEWDWFYLVLDDVHVFDIGLLTIFKNGNIRLYSDGQYQLITLDKSIDYYVKWWQENNNMDMIRKILSLKDGQTYPSSFSDEFKKGVELINEYSKNNKNINWQYLCVGIPALIVKSEKKQKMILFEGVKEHVWTVPHSNYEEFASKMVEVL